MRHTQGQWKVIHIGEELTGSIFAGKTRICSGICDDVKLAREAEANAFLIAAAPDMFAALELALPALLDIAMSTVDFAYAISAIETALRKARGEE